MSKAKRSYAGAFRAMTAAFLAAEAEILGKDRTWMPQNPLQARLLAEVFPFTRPEAELVPETKQRVAWAAGPINDFLRDNGVEIRLEELGPDTFGFASVMEVKCPWAMPGDTKDIKVGDDTFPGARVESARMKGGPSVTFSISSHFSSPIATLRTRSQDVVRITKFDEDLDAFDLVARAKELTIDASACYDFEAVHFPMVDLDVCPDVEWLLGMTTESETRGLCTLVQALQQCKLQMNHMGAIVKDAFAGAGAFESCSVRRPKPDLIVDGSLLFVLDRPGLSQPVISLVVRPDSFKDPGTLVLA